MWKGQTSQSSVQGMFKGVPDVVGGEDFAAGQGGNLQGDSWRGGGGDWSEQIDRGFDQGIDRGFDQEKNIYLPYDHPAGLVDSQWNSSGHPDLRPRTRFVQLLGNLEWHMPRTGGLSVPNDPSQEPSVPGPKDF